MTFWSVMKLDMDLHNVFVTVGTTQFDLLVKTITQPDCVQALKMRGCRKLRLQIGAGSYHPPVKEVNGVEITAYRFKESIRDDMVWADFVISHAGAGSCLEALELGKPLLVVVNTDLMGNHQFEVATKLNDCGYLHYTTCDQLREALLQLDVSRLKVYPKCDPLKFTSAIDYIVGFR